MKSLGRSEIHSQKIFQQNRSRPWPRAVRKDLVWIVSLSRLIQQRCTKDTVLRLHSTNIQFQLSIVGLKRCNFFLELVDPFLQLSHALNFSFTIHSLAATQFNRNCMGDSFVWKDLRCSILFFTSHASLLIVTFLDRRSNLRRAIQLLWPEESRPQLYILKIQLLLTHCWPDSRIERFGNKLGLALHNQN